MSTSPGYIPNLVSADIALGPDESAQALINLGLASPASAWTLVAGLQPAIACDFVNDRYYGGAALADIATTRSAGTHQFKDSAGAVLQFSANQVRRSDLGLFWDANDTMTITGAVLRAMQASAGTLLVETGVSEVVEGTFDIATGGNNTVIIGAAGTVYPFARAGNNAALGSANGAQTLSPVSNAPGNGRSFDGNIQTFALRWSAGARAVTLGGGTIVSDANGLGNLTTLYIGRYGAGAAGTGIIRSIRYFPQALTDAQLQSICTYGPTERKFAIWGDSLAAGAGVADASATSWWAKLAGSFNPDGVAFPAGVGGETTKQALDRFTTDTDAARHREWINLVWTGHNDPLDVPYAVPGSGTTGAVKAMTDQLAGEKRYIVILPVQNTTNAVGSAGYQKILDIRAAIRASFPASRIFDAPAVLAAAAPGDANNASGYTPTVHLADTIHLNQAGQDAIYAALKAQVMRLRW